MNSVLFLSQKDLDHWLDEGHVDMAQESMIFTSDKSQVAVIPAVRFMKIVAGTDQHKLIGKVKAVEVMRMGGADCSLGAVVLPDAAYEVEDGFMVTVPTATTAPAASPAAAKPAGKEADLLAQFILDKLS
jgi:hypothetical protein